MKNQYLIWRFMQGRPDGFKLSQCARAMDVQPRTVKWYVSLLREAGYVEVARITNKGPDQCLYRLVRNTGPAAPEVRQSPGGIQIFDPNLAGEVTSGRQRIWNALRIAKTTTYGDLQTLTGVCDAQVRQHMSRLTKAGYCSRKKQSGHGGRGIFIYSLIRDTGPLAPVCVAAGEIFDPNTMETIYLKEEADGTDRSGTGIAETADARYEGVAH